MKKLLFLVLILIFGIVNAQDYGDDSYGSGDDSAGDSGSSYGDSNSSYGDDKSSASNEATSLLGEEPVEIEEEKEVKEKKAEAPKNPNVPGEVHKWQIALNTSLINVTHTVNATTTTMLGLPFTATNFAAGYQISPQIWLMAKFHLFLTMTNNTATGQFLLGPGIRADFIRADKFSFFGGAFVSIGNTGKIFLFSPEVYAGVEYNVNSYFAIGAITDFTYQLAANNGATHTINFMLGPQLTIYF